MPHFQCTRCPRSSLVKSNFKFTSDGECVCVPCWEGHTRIEPRIEVSDRALASGDRNAWKQILGLN